MRLHVILEPQSSGPGFMRLRGASWQGLLEVRATASEPHHEAQVSPSGNDVASELIVEVHVLIDKIYVLFVRQKFRAQTGSQKQYPGLAQPQLQNAPSRQTSRLKVPLQGEEPWGLHGPRGRRRPVRTRRPAPVTRQSTRRCRATNVRGKPGLQGGESSLQPWTELIKEAWVKWVQALH